LDFPLWSPPLSGDRYHSVGSFEKNILGEHTVALK
jgi:hypothetical protein